ncbi:hypothetical protein VMCG_02234 [Cytospora schulzeri]|uniref:Extracellular mutant protein 11 C-terminal domain-containing protein n=1 Tax=Cytospora schulzeri TaxID=448051 RepID=A0A423X1S1_9PEZI|nr:hypothetical protein VMCG_02234 [Valsa malicola]
MVPTARKKMQSFIQKQEAGTAINPHGPTSPPRQAITMSASQPVMSISSPMVDRQDRQAAAEAMKIPMPLSKPSRLGKVTLPAPASPQFNESILQQRDEDDGGGPGWEPPAEEQQHEEGEGGLRDVWEEQSTIHSLFSEEEPNRPATAQPPMYGDDSLSDIVDNRQPPRRGRNVPHRNTESAPLFQFENGEVRMPSTMPKGFSTSMITHAPINPRADAPIYRRDPFGSTSGESSPKPARDPSFLRSNFPIRGGEEIKRLSHLERASHRIQSARRTSPEAYDSASDISEPQAYVKPTKEPAPVAKRSTVFQAIENAVMDWDGDDSDDSSQGDEFEDQEKQHTPKAAKKRTIPDDATVILNPLKPVIPQKPQKTVVLQDAALPGSPMPRAPTRQQSPSKKRRRDIDYDDATLQRMSFAELQNEPFDHDPTREVAQSPAKPPADNLGDRLLFYSSKDEKTQADFFTQMPVREWEDSGDWFLEQFGDIMSKMREARQMKRKVVEKYEAEVSNREEEVRRKKESIDRKLLKLKHDSAAMLRGDHPQG